MTPFFISRLVGLVIFAIVGIRIGIEVADFIGFSQDNSAFIFFLVGSLFGLTATPWITIYPLNQLRKAINEMPVERLVMAIVGAFLGLVLALLVAYPLSLMDEPFGQVAPVIVSIVSGYLFITLLTVRAKEIIDTFINRFGGRALKLSSLSTRELIVDTSVLIDGRITDVAETGFLGGILIIPRFVLNELHRVADSPDQLRRNRGRRGLDKLKELQRGDDSAVKIIDDDIENIPEVDAKLVALALQRQAAIITNDYNLNQVAEAQNVEVLNINQLANAVRSVYIPGESFELKIIQEGTDPQQGVGYLEDGTMVVVEKGKTHMNNRIPVSVTKLIQKPTGRIIFAEPTQESATT